MSAKSLSNQLKSKGLQRLRWYCQLCEKQCRDENGFKCHCSSPAHVRQLAVFAQNQKKVVDGFSSRFKTAFISELSLNHRNSRVAANKVYNELIANKTHVHMNATRWTSLTEFVHHLVAEGVCEIDETDKGIFITYLHAESKIFQGAVARKRTHEDDGSARKQEKLIERQVKRGAVPAKPEQHEPTGLKLQQTGFNMDLTRKEKPSQMEQSHLVGTIMRIYCAPGEQSKQKYIVTNVYKGMATLEGIGPFNSAKVSTDHLRTVIPVRGPHCLLSCLTRKLGHWCFYKSYTRRECRLYRFGNKRGCVRRLTQSTLRRQRR